MNRYSSQHQRRGLIELGKWNGIGEELGVKPLAGRSPSNPDPVSCRRQQMTVPTQSKMSLLVRFHSSRGNGQSRCELETIFR